MIQPSSCNVTSNTHTIHVHIHRSMIKVRHDYRHYNTLPCLPSRRFDGSCGALHQSTTAYGIPVISKCYRITIDFTPAPTPIGRCAINAPLHPRPVSFQVVAPNGAADHPSLSILLDGLTVSGLTISGHLASLSSSSSTTRLCPRSVLVLRQSINLASVHSCDERPNGGKSWADKLDW